MTTAETSGKPTGIVPALKPLQMKEAQELAQYYRVPPSLMNTFAIQFGDTVYWKEAFLLERAHQRGLQRIEVDKPLNDNGEWTTEARIYPRQNAKTPGDTSLLRLGSGDEHPARMFECRLCRSGCPRLPSNAQSVEH